MRSLMLLFVLAFATPIQAEPPVSPAVQAAAMSEGTVRKLDLPNGKVTLRHGPIVNLDMPPMTMVFRVSDGKLLEGLKPGQTVGFAAEKRDGAYTVTHIQPVP